MPCLPNFPLEVLNVFLGTADSGCSTFKIRWHPVMIKWCLNLKLLSSSLYVNDWLHTSPTRTNSSELHTLCKSEKCFSG